MQSQSQNNKMVIRDQDGEYARLESCVKCGRIYVGPPGYRCEACIRESTSADVRAGDATEVPQPGNTKTEVHKYISTEAISNKQLQHNGITYEAIHHSSTTHPPTHPPTRQPTNGFFRSLSTEESEVYQGFQRRQRKQAFKSLKGFANRAAENGREWFTINEPYLRKRAGFKDKNGTYHLLTDFVRLGILERRPFGRTHEYKWTLPTKESVF